MRDRLPWDAAKMAADGVRVVSHTTTASRCSATLQRADGKRSDVLFERVGARWQFVRDTEWV